MRESNTRIAPLLLHARSPTPDQPACVLLGAPRIPHISLLLGIPQIGSDSRAKTQFSAPRNHTHQHLLLGHFFVLDVLSYVFFRCPHRSACRHQDVAVTHLMTGRLLQIIAQNAEMPSPPNQILRHLVEGLHAASFYSFSCGRQRAKSLRFGLRCGALHSRGRLSVALFVALAR